MIYLATQMLLFLTAASIIGIVIGWWLGRLNRTPTNDEPEFSHEDIQALKYRLDKSFDENTALRNQLKVTEAETNKLQGSLAQKPMVLGDDGDVNHLHEKLDVLLEDLQLRDDTIFALEKELERLKFDNSVHPVN